MRDAARSPLASDTISAQPDGRPQLQMRSGTALSTATASIIEHATSLLHSTRAPVWLGLLALLMSLPSLGLGLQLDDRTYMRLFATGRSPLDLLHESATSIVREKAIGVFAWWSAEQFTVYFLRPGAALTHWLEFRLWPDAPWLMHLTSCCLYALLVAVAAALYRELTAGDGKLAGLAALMFTVDEAHAQSVGWIASRHVVLASLLALLAVYLHVRGRRQRRTTLVAASVLAHALAVSSAEFGLCALAYLLAYACVLEPGTLRTRLWSVSPHLLIGGLWLLVYGTLGCGVHGASWYRDPLGAPGYTLREGLFDLPLWLLSQLGGDVANLGLALQQSTARLLALGLLIPLAPLLLPPLAASRPARFFATGMLLSCAFLFSTVPQDRLLLAASFGGFGWLACVLTTGSTSASAYVRSGAAVLRLPHLTVAPLMFIPMLGGLSAIDASVQALAAAIPAQGTSQVIAVNLPLELLTNSAWSLRNGSDIPLHQLYAGFAAMKASRPDARTLELTVDDGWGTRPLERMFTAEAEHMPRVGETRTVVGMRVSVVATTQDGLPQRVRFEFPDALEASGRVWLVWNGRRPSVWKPPAIGTQIEVPTASRAGLVF